MARLLLVDDNPSIHKIAETLLGASYVQLVCVDSAEAALGLLEAGEAFDIALIDTTMPGMDGWELLSRLRANPATAHIPVAMMAGVLDTVDPERLATAPIQGFLKKPIELRDLPDRVRQLLGTPVSTPQPPPPASLPDYVPTQPLPPEPNPYATQPPGTPLPSIPSPVLDTSDLETMPPGTKLSDLQGLAAPDPGDLVTLPPGTKLHDLPGLSPTATTPGLQLDLLLLTPDDLWVEEPEALPPDLDLEELDLETLRSLPLEGSAAVAAAPAPEPSPVLEPPLAGFHAPLEAGAAPTWDELPPVAASTPTAPEFPMDLSDLEPAPAGFRVVSGEVLGVPAEAEEAPEPVHALLPSFPEPEPAPMPAPEMAAALPGTSELPPIQTLDLDADALPPMETALDAWPPAAEPPPSSHPMAAALAVGAVGAAGGLALGSLLGTPATPPGPMAPAPPPMAPGPGEGPRSELLQALLADPAALDALAKAVVARLGDQVLREIAWDVMPELAEKLHRPS